MSDGDILLTARSVAFPEITGTAVLHISGLGQPSLAVDAQVTSSDYYEGYDKRCYPWRAVNGITDNYSGWCSAALCSEEAPVYLYIDLRQEKVFCQIDLIYHLPGRFSPGLFHSGSAKGSLENRRGKDREHRAEEHISFPADNGPVHTGGVYQRRQ